MAVTGLAKLVEEACATFEAAQKTLEQSRYTTFQCLNQFTSSKEAWTKNVLVLENLGAKL